MKVKPLADRVLVKQAAAETKTAGGLFIPETAQEKTQQAVVEAVGGDGRHLASEREKEKITVKPGDKVLYDKYSGTAIKIDGEDYLILKNSDIIATIE